MPSITQYLTDFITGSTGNLSLTQAVGALIVAYFGGVLASLTPCVYPMIPITVSIVGGLGHARKTWKEVYFRGLCYVAGMTLVYSFLGVLAGISGKVFGSLTNTSGWYLFLGLTLTFASLWMLEVIEFDPAQVWSRFQRRTHSSHSHHPNPAPANSTWIGAFFLGASSGFIAAPCTTPVLTAILAFIAKTQSIGLGFALMVSFSLGLGTLLLAIAAFTGSLQLLPKSGTWMRGIKILSGLILLAFAEGLIYRAGVAGGP